MRRLVLLRLLGLVATGLVTSAVVFFALHLIPGDPAVTIAGEGATPSMIAATRAELGLDRPLALQYVDFLGRLLHGDLGISYQSHEAVAVELSSRFAATVELSLCALLFSLAVGMPTGLLGLRGGFVGRLADFLSASIVGIPPFWLGLLALILLYGQLGWLPGGGRFPLEGLAQRPITGLVLLDSVVRLDWRDLVVGIQHLILPVATLGLAIAGLIARTTRAAVGEAMLQPYVTVARAKGLDERTISLRHAIPNAAIPVLIVSGLALGDLFGGAVLTETIFSWPGIGRYAIDAIYQNDYPAVMGFVILFAMSYAVLNALADIAVYRLDPRISVP